MIKSTATFRVVHTELDFADLEELGDVDKDGGEESRKEVVEDPGGPGLDLPVVVRSADCEVPLNTHCYDQVDAQAQNYPEQEET